MKRFLGVFIVLFMIFGISFSAFAFWGDNLKKAKEFALIERYELADKAIQEVILEDPTNAEMHYQAGVIYFNMGWKGHWTKAFRIAVKIDKTQSSKVAKFYEEMGFLQFKKENMSSSDILRYFLPAIEFGGEKKKKEICTQLHSISKDYVLEPNFKKAGESFRALCRLCPENGDFACNALMRMADLYPVKSRLRIYRTVSSFSKVCNFQIGEKIALIAKLDNIEKSFSDKCKKEARKYLSKNEYEKFFPLDYVIYGPGQAKVFKLKAGEVSDHYVRPKYGSHIRLQSKFGQYEVVMRSGKIYPKGKFPKHNLEDFLIRAVTDMDMRIVFS